MRGGSGTLLVIPGVPVRQPGTENGGAFNRTLFDSIADRVGLDRGTFDACLADPAQTNAVMSDTSKALEAGINATPTVLVNGTRVSSWALSIISQAIDAAAANSTPPAPSGPPASPVASPSAS